MKFGLGNPKLISDLKSDVNSKSYGDVPMSIWLAIQLYMSKELTRTRTCHSHRQGKVFRTELEILRSLVLWSESLVWIRSRGKVTTVSFKSPAACGAAPSRGPNIPVCTKEKRNRGLLARRPLPAPARYYWIWGELKGRNEGLVMAERPGVFWSTRYAAAVMVDRWKCQFCREIVSPNGTHSAIGEKYGTRHNSD